MANNKVQLADGTVLIDLTDTTAVATDIAAGKYAYGANGEKLTGIANFGNTVIYEGGALSQSNDGNGHVTVTFAPPSYQTWQGGSY